MKTVLLMLAACTALAACSTVEGVGNDISAGARKVSDIL